MSSRAGYVLQLTIIQAEVARVVILAKTSTIGKSVPDEVSGT